MGRCAMRGPSSADPGDSGRSRESGASASGAPRVTDAPRFLCDEMLGRLARYLRAAGYDTLLARHGLPDRAWVALARREHRWLLTCDRGVDEHLAARGLAIVLPRGDLAEAARTLVLRCDVDWLHAPFTRCLVDNTRLGSMPDAIASRLPADVGAARWCPDCGRAYWAGSHYRRMQARLAAWAAGNDTATGSEARASL